LLAVRAFADALGLGTPTVRRWIAERRIAHVRIGSRAIRVPTAELDRLVSEGMVPALDRDDA